MRFKLGCALLAMRAILALAVLSLFPAAASAALLTIDMRGTAFNPAGFTDTWTANNVAPGDDLAVTLETSFGFLTWSPENGIGIKSLVGYSSQVEGPERLVVSFSKDVNLVAFGIGNLFLETITGQKCPATGCYYETGEVMLNDSGIWSSFSAAPNSVQGTSGYNEYLQLQKNVSKMEFRFPGLVIPDGFWYPQLHEGTLATLTIDLPEPPKPIPEPGTILLVGAGAIGLWRKRRAMFP